ncbi:ATP-dependent helicase [Candidatus Methylobacter favarea]|uniref:ATP-dependent helicase n=1 Tax=Candidatus Methylobacter favarea TaxID=2707345 RepID=A0A8S0X9B5_9GAMM|nr:SNF2-related protein [Candidatus Methylobacter favarea]CAA9892086.1 ATP-dependent helicase [Candidatus Methylobacter favarea]
MITLFHAKYFAYELTRRHAPTGIGRLSQSLFDASVDLNPHQIEAALFALKSPLSKGVLLADEVGLGKTIEAGIVLCQYWSERRRRLLVICPASLRKQWALEMEEKFNLPAVVLDAKTWRGTIKKDRSPLNQKAIIILSYNYANRIRDELKAIAWDLVVIDEAHKLRNAYRESNKIGQGLRWALEDCRKLLLTATPLQNSLLELYGLSTLIDEHLFGDVNAFRSQYVSAGGDLDGLRQRLSGFCRRTLRNQVTEYIRYTERKAITRPFRPTDDEHQLYEAVTAFLQRPDSYAIPKRQRHLTELILRKLLASSSLAIAGTLETMKLRLEALRDEKIKDDPEFAEFLIADEDIEDELLDEILNIDPPEENGNTPQPTIDRKQLKEEIDWLAQLVQWARSIGTDTKTRSLLSALEIGFQQMATTGAQRKALIFTESRRTQIYLKDYLEANGYAGQVVQFSGANNSPEATIIYENWLTANQGTGRIAGSRDIDIRAALIENFRDQSSIMIATEAAAEGVNIQFCSLVINYDLPWNPQRVEQRIGRCHRYGQQHDVVVINFLNERNEADRRVLELLTEKFNLFNGVFGASDDVLGSIESGVDFEKRILSIYQECRTPAEIDDAFKALQAEMDERIQARMNDTRKLLLENFDEDVHERLRIQLSDAKAQLDRFSKRFWSITHFILNERAQFNDAALTFDLVKPPTQAIAAGRYHLISKTTPNANQPHTSETAGEMHAEYGTFLYRLSHPLGEFVIDHAKTLDTPPAHIVFDVSQHPTRLHQIEALRGKHGYLAMTLLAIESYEREEHLLFSAIDDQGLPLEQETCEKLFNCAAENSGSANIPGSITQRLAAEAQQHTKATISQSLEANNRHFNEAREKLEKWADDRVLAAEKALKDTKEQIKILQRQARLATNLDEQHDIQQKIQKLEKQQRRQRQEIFQVEDSIIEKRDALIDALERRLTQKTESARLFTIEWSVV